MKKEDKELLFKDLCARLSYGTTVVYCQNENDWFEEEVDVGIISICINDEYVVKPYLFPMSSLKEEQKEELVRKRLGYYQVFEGAGRIFFFEKGYEVYDWLNEHHFDYRDLIEKELAIDATNLNIY